MKTLTLLFVLANQQGSDWWRNYGDPELNRIIERALTNNPDLQSATQRIAEARAMTGESRSKLGPTIQATGSGQRLRGGFAQNIIRVPNPSGAEQSGSFVSPFETGLIQGGLDMKWELDLFGSNRAGVQAAKADLEEQEQRLQDLSITISAEIARNYMELRGIEERIAITFKNVALQRDLLLLTQDRVRAGIASQLDVERQQVLVATTEASLADLEADRAIRWNRLAVLVGDESFAKSIASGSSHNLTAPSLNANIPGEVLKRRPDVRAAEARLTAAMARLKQARADLYPRISLNGLAGRQGTSFTTLGLGGGNFFNIGPQIQLPLFNSGRIKANIAASDARVEQAKLNYRSEILAAFEEAANAISSLERQREREAKLRIASEGARSSMLMSEDLQRAGLSDFLTVIDSQRILLDSEYQRSLAQTQVLVQSVQLYKALAGGWPD